ncbi:MAG: hypothetical protein COW05_04665, partial [Gammaproteobacteria bacterium CG12_big_fil_rev_8_21_14_0_65_46_12]
MSEDSKVFPSDEQSKAEQEKWKAIQKAIPLTERSLEFLGKVVGPSVEAFGGLLGDQMKSWRAANLDRLSEKWRKKIEERKVSKVALQALPFGDAYRTLEFASMEDDPDVLDLWAQIICNATDENHDAQMKKMFVDLLRQINGLEARILSIIFEHHDRYILPHEKYEDDEKFMASMQKYLGDQDTEKLRVSLMNLCRLGILTHSITEFEVFESSTHEEWIKSVNKSNIVEKITSALSNLVAELTDFSGSPMNDVLVPNERHINFILSFILTHIGWDLYRACTYP